MSYEIELKAHIEDYKSVKNRLFEIADFEFEYTKEDDYWSGLKSGVRIRKEKTIDSDGVSKDFILVTYKTKEVRDSIEVNTENEFVISNAPGSNNALSSFQELLTELHLKPYLSKKKQGFSFKSENITAELSFVENLGWFLELEIIADNDSTQTINSARTKLLSLLNKAGIGEEKIETRYYSEMLAEQKK